MIKYFVTIILLHCIFLSTATAQSLPPGKFIVKAGTGSFYRLARIGADQRNTYMEAPLKDLRFASYWTAQAGMSFSSSQNLFLVHSRSSHSAGFTYPANGGGSPASAKGTLHERITYSGMLYMYQIFLDEKGRHVFQGGVGVGLWVYHRQTDQYDNISKSRARGVGYQTAAAYEFRFSKNIGWYVDFSSPAGCAGTGMEEQNLSQVRLGTGLVCRF